ncbi:MAG: histidine--tRNA ligase [Alphaproteobacteria bacterium]|nr:histidine--tRNA ligase [Alphaproteobacteria bacterium]
MASLQPVRGTHDIHGETMRRHRHVEETARNLAARYGYGEIAPPIFEFTPVFARTLGEGSDIVRKEMYTFTDRGGEEVTLRPEFTAGIARAFISEGWRQNLPLKFFAAGPVFRYERPQRGRLRQFHQIDAEILGVAGPEADIEIIALGAEILERLGALDRCRLLLNTLGDPASRQAYRHALLDYFSRYEAKLSPDSRDRLVRNPLRILDSKDPGDRALLAEAPLLHKYLNPASLDFFAAVCRGLDRLGVAYQVNQRLVRGLDYYTHTAFEFVTEALGSQGAVIAGGRYDGLIETLGGPSTPGIGWAGGIERLGMLTSTLPATPGLIALVALGQAAEERAWLLARELRALGHVVDLGFGGGLGRQMKRADRIGARAAILLGDDELSRGEATLRDLGSGEQRRVALPALAGSLGAYR